ncbi:MAG: hypothetical protein ACLFU4_08225 [Opitutales bacterium]
MKVWLLLGIFVYLGYLGLQATTQSEKITAGSVEPDSAERADRFEGAEEESHFASRKTTFDRLSFLNGDVLSGLLVSADAEEGLAWVHPYVEEPIRFKLGPLREVKFKGPFPDDALEGLARVRIRNGDEYRGQILRMDEDSLFLDTPYAGEVEIAVPMIVSLHPQAAASEVYRGPIDLEVWTTSLDAENTGWALRKKALYYEGSSGESLGKRFEDIPDRAEIALDLAWRSDLQFTINFWADELKNSTENYSLMLQRGYVRCYRNSRQHGRQDLGNSRVQSLQAKSEARIRLFLNREEKELALMINDKLVKKWVDYFEGEVSGDVLQFLASGNIPVKIENLVIREWDGSFEKENEEKVIEDRDLLILGNGDQFSGEVLSISDDTLRFKTDFAELPIPLDRIVQVNLAMAHSAEPRRLAGDVRLVFPTRERVTLKLDSLTDGSFRGRSETTGEVMLRTRFVSGLILNPYDERHLTDDKAW